MRRTPGTLLPLEEAILDAGLDLRQHGQEEFYGFLIAKRLQEAGETRSLVAHGTLYKALDRMHTQGLLDRRWEDALLAAAEQRPRRRLYTVTMDGARALAKAKSAWRDTSVSSPGWVTP